MRTNSQHRMTGIGITVETYPDLDNGWGYDIVDATTGTVMGTGCGYLSEAQAARRGKAHVADQLLSRVFPDLYLLAVDNPAEGVPGGSVGRCIARMESRPDVDDPGALCAWIARQRGENPRKRRGSSKGRAPSRRTPALRGIMAKATK